MRTMARASAGFVALLLLAPAADAKVKGFRFGVTAGEVSDDSARIWGAAKGSGKVRAKVATDRKFRHVAKSKRIKAKGSNDHTIQTNVKGLDADQLYWYRFCAKGASCGPKGRFTTAPKPSENETIRFGYTGDTDATRAPGESEPFFGHFEAFRAMRDEKNDFNIHFGDTIYSDSEVGGSPPALTVEEKWGKLNLGETNLTRLRRSAGFYSHWDDHEFINDFSIPEDGEQLYQAGVEAFRDYAPSPTPRTRACTAASGGARTWSCSSSTSCRSGPARRPPAARATTRRQASPTSPRPPPQLFGVLSRP
jgi:alkaline phosphatase D